ncbi:uncharacterized protein K460DRAFT_409045 [Cucurbitaria berberidis CBS 394.84]|uniref:Essential protein Yae1 N-terminal domain-containing protein n=1 Tax=Cucurbitaria berberidis CBS 394.84 TaxID=1168544 RepID=A0A9P4G9Z6_9PLEO|nr:uncharacterized protein K460DRAFT_409045 [Cucurbitaria berberidis CBS 394.84]KAF1841586.1 hypothetical protein K460DRAFT_409045 [Cucurbitaria berberidis CBS 394.84]
MDWNSHKAKEIAKSRNEGYDQGKKDGYETGRRVGSNEGRMSALTLLETTKERVGKDEGYANGYNNGLAAGHSRGHQKGHAKGRLEAFSEASAVEFGKGHDEGYEKGWGGGYNEGHGEGRRAGQEEGKTEGHDKGYYKGYGDGHLEGQKLGKIEGHDEGYDEGWLKGVLHAEKNSKTKLREHFCRGFHEAMLMSSTLPPPFLNNDRTPNKYHPYWRGRSVAGYIRTHDLVSDINSPWFSAHGSMVHPLTLLRTSPQPLSYFAGVNDGTLHYNKPYIPVPNWIPWADCASCCACHELLW